MMMKAKPTRMPTASKRGTFNRLSQRAAGVSTKLNRMASASGSRISLTEIERADDDGGDQKALERRRALIGR